VPVSVADAALAAALALVLLGLVGLLTVLAAAGAIRDTPDPYELNVGDQR